MIETLRVPVTVRWYSAGEGGRRTGPPPGPKYTPTGRFADQPLEQMFSVILTMPEAGKSNTASFTAGELAPAFPENTPEFADRLARGDIFILHEGRRAVAECIVAATGA
jgi:hypothetical protein